MRRKGQCSRPNCNRLAGARNLCDPHYFSLYQHGLVDCTATAQHILALRTAGMSLYRIAELSGLSRDGLADAASGNNLVQKSTQQAVTAIPIPSAPVDEGSRAVPAVGTVRRLRALAVLGWTMQALSVESGVPSRTLAESLAGQRRPTARTASAVAAAFSRLQLTHGPSQIASRRANQKGWHGPLHWDEDTIDDPKSRPRKPRNRRHSFVDRYTEVVQHLGIRDVESIADRLGIDVDSLERQLTRHRPAS